MITSKRILSVLLSVCLITFPCFSGLSVSATGSRLGTEMGKEEFSTLYKVDDPGIGGTKANVPDDLPEEDEEDLPASVEGLAVTPEEDLTMTSETDLAMTSETDLAVTSETESTELWPLSPEPLSSKLDLSGTWLFALGSYEDVLTAPIETVIMPGTLDENEKGAFEIMVDYERFSRRYVYWGPAIYQRTVFVPTEWNGKQIRLFMERTKFTRVWVNDVQINPDSPWDAFIMSAPQVYDITSELIYNDNNVITIEVDNYVSSQNANTIPINPAVDTTKSKLSVLGVNTRGIYRGCMTSEDVQTNWNGILGKFELQVEEKASLSAVRAYPNEDLQSVKIEVDIRNDSSTLYTGKVTARVVQGFGAEPAPVTKDVSVAANTVQTVVIDSDYGLGAGVQLWSEFEQFLYTIEAELEDGNALTDRFGMRRIAVDPTTKQLILNGDTKLFLRNETNCCIFPLTGYAPMDKEGWLSLFRTYKDYGVNSVRFHSWCPPEAAFFAADELGLYLQPENPNWNNSSTFGSQADRDYWAADAKAQLKAYANHPSFIAFTFGNELGIATTMVGGMNGRAYADYLMDELRAYDDTRLYSFGSNVSTGTANPTDGSDFFTVYRHINNERFLRATYSSMYGYLNNKYPSSDLSYSLLVEDLINRFDLPVFSFEVGQYQIFPDILTETNKYTGVVRALNFELYEELVADKGISDELVEKYINASGMLSRLCYRVEIEAALRTKNLSGISLLGIQDFPGQGTAVVGMVNALGETKPYGFADPEEYKKFFNSVVPLAELQKFSWMSDEIMNFNILVANYGSNSITNTLSYKLYGDNGVVAEESFISQTAPQGDVSKLKEVAVNLSSIDIAVQLKLEIKYGDYVNEYDIWVFPADITAYEKVNPECEVYIAEYLDATALEILDNGGKVFLTPSISQQALPKSLRGHFSNSFWSSIFASASQPGTEGLLMDPGHPVFGTFPTEYYSNFQWWPMASTGRPMILDGITDMSGNEIDPLVRVIDGFTKTGAVYNPPRTLGLLFEAKVGNGKLMVSSMGLDQLQVYYPEAKALRNSIFEYMHSDDFDPEFEMTVSSVETLVSGPGTDPRRNVALESNGGVAFAEDTATYTAGYLGLHDDRLTEMIDGIADPYWNIQRSWSDRNSQDSNGTYSGATANAMFGVELKQPYTVEAVNLALFVDTGNAFNRPTSISIAYWDEDTEAYIPVANPSMTSGFAQGFNLIEFDPVETTKIRATTNHGSTTNAVAISQFAVLESTQERTEQPIECDITFSVNPDGTCTAVITPVEGCEYSFNGITYSSTNIKDNCKPESTITGYIRYAATDGYYASDPTTNTVQVPPTIQEVNVVDEADGITSISAPYTGQKLAVEIITSNGIVGYEPINADAVYIWYYKGSSTVIGVGSVYTVTNDDVGKVICVEVSIDGYLGTIIWEADYVTVAVFSIAATAGAGGTVTGGGEYIEGASVTVTASSSVGYMFEGWYENNVKISGAGAVYSFSAVSDRSLVARFNRSTSGGGNTSSGGSTVASGTPTPTPTPTSTPTPTPTPTLTTDSSTSSPTPAPTGSGNTTDIGGGVTVWTPEMEGPVINSDGSVTMPGGGTISTQSGIVINVPAGTTITSDGMVSFSAGAVGAVLTHKNGFSFNIAGGAVVFLDENLPLGYSLSVNNKFEDVNESDWFYDSVMFVYLHGLMVGTSSEPMLFSPDDPLTRAMVVTVLCRLQNAVPAIEYENPFSDVVEGEWYANAVKWAAANDIVLGYGDGTYGPNDYITREQMAAILYRYEQFTGNIPVDVTIAKEFADQNEISEYAKNAVDKLTMQNIITGKPDNLFDPSGNATRAEFAAMLYKLIAATR